MKCPRCGYEDHKPTYQTPWTYYRRWGDTTHSSILGGAAQDNGELPDLATRDTPLRGPTSEDFWVPTKRSVWAGIWFGVTLGVLIGILTPKHTRIGHIRLDLGFGNDVLVTLFLVAIIGGVLWFIFTQRADRTLTMHERIENKRKREPDHVIVDASLYHEDVNGEEVGWHMASWPAPSLERMWDYAAALLADTSTFSEKGAARYGFTQKQFNELKNKFITAGWADWRNPDRTDLGAALNEAGRTVLQQIIEGRE